MNPNESELLEGLRALAALDPKQAPERVERALMATFRARSERRRRTLLGSGIAAAAAIAAAVAVLFFASSSRASKTTVPRIQATAPVPAELSVPAAPPVVTAQVRYAVVRTEDLAATFYPVPEAEELPPMETTMVVRVQMPVSSLRLMGVPVGDDFGAEPVQADVLLGQDGLARGVRLIQ